MVPKHEVFKVYH